MHRNRNVTKMTVLWISITVMLIRTHPNADPDFYLMRIQIPIQIRMPNDADPC
jgi:hypothetical protein